MPSKRQMRLAAIRAIAEREGWKTIDARAWAVLRAKFGELSESTLRHDLRELDIPCHPLIEGVRLDNLDNLQRTLMGLCECYRTALVLDPGNRMNEARRLVLAARKKAEMVLRNPSVDAEKRTAMEEKFLWIRTWLENPPVFESWALLRARNLGNPEGPPAHPSFER